MNELVFWVEDFLEYYNLNLTLVERDLLREMTESLAISIDLKVDYDESIENIKSDPLYSGIIDKSWFKSAVSFAAGWIITYKRIHNGH